MGWKTDTLLIRPFPQGVVESDLLHGIGFANTAPLGEATLETAIWPDDRKVYIATLRDCGMICARGVTDGFFKPAPTPLAQLCLNQFPDAEVAALILHSVVNLWGFALYRRGVAIRCKAGSSDDGTFLDSGDPLAEEAEQLSYSKVDAAGRRLYRLPDFPDEVLSEDQVGEEYVFRMFERFLGERPDRSAALLDAPCRAYRFSSLRTSPAPWWKFWN